MKDGKRLGRFLKRKAGEVGGHIQESWERKRVGWITGAKQRKFEKQELKQIEKQAYQEARMDFARKEARRRGREKAKQRGRGGGVFGAVGKLGDYGAGVMKNVEEGGMLIDMGGGKHGNRSSYDPLGLYGSPRRRVVHRRKKSKRKR